ncbi:hypothetical protein Tco_0249305, partial [Tanacetum coccineum]
MNRIVEIKTSKQIGNGKLASLIHRAVAVGMKWGNLSAHQLVKTSDAHKVSINELFIFVFPTVASLMIYNRPNQFKDNRVGLRFCSKYLPPVLAHTGAAGMIPRGPVGQVYLALHTAYMMEVS